MAMTFREIMKRAKLWQALRILTACALSYIVTGMLGLPEGYWAVITAAVVTQGDLSSTLEAGRDRILGTIIGAAVGLAVIEANVAWGWPLENLFWIALIPLAIVTAIKPNLRLCCVTLAVVVLVPAAGTWHRPLDRVTEILVGTLASIAVSAIIFPRKRTMVPAAVVTEARVE
jgi:uncharacterized membrane protein YccC